MLTNLVNNSSTTPRYIHLRTLNFGWQKKKPFTSAITEKTSVQKYRGIKKRRVEQIMQG
ncbi:hypothetical protein ABOUO_42 [Brevibacillus phage Abouo]|uniref:Uncharacterized protein n=2 Tax=Abouovirus TaxID=1984773 RepID=S5MUS0_9CAUD|nr:hypothetical protein DAVIES_42 [Brevibacillus phage Davies]YP_009220099.1 hypothetical protein AVV45_gp42 [Brevibacillus phage Abouo]AGR47479.1 hypothetical protein ABOUO_42 [Brevibacillus phage Abouo]AGR47572.1 hypothetical protein DAVIES_42 [Brevibacillus phage Davies]